jgi:hypothetical protein
LHQESDVDGENYNSLLLLPSQFARLIISDMSTCLSAKVKLLRKLAIGRCIELDHNLMKNKITHDSTF